MILESTQKFTEGFLLPAEATRLIFKKSSLKLWAFLPLVLSILIIVFGGKSLEQWFERFWQSWMISHGFMAGEWGLRLTTFFVKVVFWVGSIFLFPMVVSLVGSPLLDFLAEATEPFCDPPLPRVRRMNWPQTVRLLSLDFGKHFVASIATGSLLLLSWIPAVDFAAWTGAVLLTTFQFVSYPQTRRGIGLTEGIGFLFKNFPICFGFGLSVTLLMAIPIISAFFVPVAVVGGTLLFGRTLKNRRNMNELARR